MLEFCKPIQPYLIDSIKRKIALYVEAVSTVRGSGWVDTHQGLIGNHEPIRYGGRY